MRLQFCMKNALPFAVMIMLECGDVCAMTLGKAALNIGMNNLVFVVYYNALGTLILLPFFIFHRLRSQQPPLSFSLLCRFSLLGLLGICLVQICGYTGINYSSPALASAMGNLLPAFTFLLAIIFRMEKFDLRRLSSQVKSVGTIVAVSGAFVMILYRGPLITTSASNLHHRLLLSQQQSNWVLGGLVLGTACFVTSIWSIAQAATVKEYPDEMTVVFFYCFFGSVQCAIFTLIAERNPTAWTLQPGIEMIAVVFSAIHSTVFRSAALTWCLHKKGPVYVAMFKPTQMVIAVVFGLIFLGDALYLGSVIGGTIIAFGFYTMMWGKAKEEDNVCTTLESSTPNTPLLQNNVGQEK
ncbi:WAT1-related protein [Camellia lanceoleosa]|uniref:WAT1-related protein n=1 Tax=Camellia lanceoleosa TaxID=1840588 RepID=A0ACC0IYI4_9ERIC|nr:WAT1-related protein [Camellia lanceoleosa]